MNKALVTLFSGLVLRAGPTRAARVGAPAGY